MSTDQYVKCVNMELERLLVFETVFKEYIHTCKNIEKGNCYASESFERLRLYFAKNILRFNRFVDQCAKLSAPRGYEAFNASLVKGLQGIKEGVTKILMAIEPDAVNQSLFTQGLNEQQKSRADIDAAFSQIDVAAI